MKLYNRKTNDTAPISQPDPYIIKSSDGRFYLYATYGQVYSSDSLLGVWKYEGMNLHMPQQHTCWAPCVIELDGRFYMYYSSISDGNSEEHAQQIRIAVADKDVYKRQWEYRSGLC